MSISKFISLKSDSSLNFYPENNTNSFTNILPFEINSDEGELEIGLIDFYYVPKFCKNKETVFGHEPGDNLIRIINKSGETLRLLKEPVSITQFALKINDLFKKYQVNARFRIQEREEGTYFTFINSMGGAFQIEIQIEWSNIFGFSSNVFEIGETPGTKRGSQILFDLLDINSAITIECYEKTDSSLIVQEPTEKTIEKLLEKINLAVYGAGVNFTYASNEIVCNNIESTEAYIKFSQRLDLIFGLDFSAWFSPQNKKFRSYANIDIGEKKDILLILVDIIEYQIYGNTSIPLIKTFLFDNEQILKDPSKNQLIHKKISNVQYIPVKKTKNLKSIQINLLHEDLSYIEIAENSITLASFHLRSRDF